MGMVSGAKLWAAAQRGFYRGLFLLLAAGLWACNGIDANLSPVEPALVDEPSTVAGGQPASLVETATATLPPLSPAPPAPASPTRRPTFTPSPTRRATASPTASPSASPSPTASATATALPSDTPLPPATATFTPLPQPTPTTGGFSLTVPILMYHYLSTPPAGADAIRLDLSVSPQNFEAHLAYLREAGYETISLNELSYALSQEMTLPAKPIIITFDDGYRDNYENAFPLLVKYDYTATFFIFTQPIDTYNVNYLTWEMVIEMHQAGMEFGSHSYRHADLRNRDVDFLVYEILGSKEAIEERIGQPVRFFAYPSGQYDDLTIQVLDSANFWGAVTTHWGANQAYNQRFEMPRIRIRGSDTAVELEYKLKSIWP
jgi:peptidoglycan/xylan/chitin deacetylase (PgdA/CDA1 family)